MKDHMPFVHYHPGFHKTHETVITYEEYSYRKKEAFALQSPITWEWEEEMKEHIL